MYTPTLQALTFNLGGRDEDIFLENQCIRLDKHSYIIGQPLSHRVSLSNPKGINILGVKFTPLGLYLLTGIDMKHISDKIIDAGDIWGNETAILYEQILSKHNNLEQIAVLEQFLKNKRKHSSQCPKVHLLNNAITLLKSKKMFSVSQLRENNYVTKKTLERYFLNHIGVGPKQYANISRFNHILTYLDGLASEPEWHEIVVSFGYYDHSHLIKDFKRYAGKTPAEYFSQLKYTRSFRTKAELHQIFK